MLLIPRNFKYKKCHKNICKNTRYNFNLKFINSSFIRLISLSNGRISSSQLLAIRLLIKKGIKKFGFLTFKIYPHNSITKKPAEIRMGKGKGPVSSWSAVLALGVVICEIIAKSSSKKKIISILRRVQIRLPIKTRIVS